MRSCLSRGTLPLIFEHLLVVTVGELNMHDWDWFSWTLSTICLSIEHVCEFRWNVHTHAHEHEHTHAHRPVTPVNKGHTTNLSLASGVACYIQECLMNEVCTCDAKASILGRVTARQRGLGYIGGGFGLCLVGRWALLGGELGWIFNPSHSVCVIALVDFYLPAASIDINHEGVGRGWWIFQYFIEDLSCICIRIYIDGREAWGQWWCGGRAVEKPKSCVGLCLKCVYLYVYKPKV